MVRVILNGRMFTLTLQELEKVMAKRGNEELKTSSAIEVVDYHELCK